MPSRFRDLISTLTGSRDGMLPSAQSFAPLDVDRIADQLRISERGSGNGRLNLPAHASVGEDSVERDIAAEIERWARIAEEEYHSQLALYNGRIGRAQASAGIRASVDAAGESALTDFRVQAIDDQNHLFNGWKEVEGRDQEFEAFRNVNRLSRLPKGISRNEMVFRWLVLGLFIVAESTLNGTFFARGSERGLIGGVMEAFVLSVLNVGGAVLWGRYGLPLLHHCERGIKAVGVLTTVAYATWALGLNFAIGHFRDLFVQGEGQVSATDLLSRLTTAPLIFGDAESLILVVLGLFLSLLSAIDAFGMDDRYPGFGNVGRHRREAVNLYADQKARCLAGLTERRDVAIEEMSKIIELARSSEHEISVANSGRNRLQTNFRSYLRHLSEAYGRLIQRYREANQSARTAPSPPRFDTRPNLPALAAMEPSPLEDVDFARQARGEVVSRLEYYIRAVNQEFEEAVRRFRTVEGLTELGA